VAHSCLVLDDIKSELDKMNALINTFSNIVEKDKNQYKKREKTAKVSEAIAR
jgi:hypothetical protein